MTKANGVRVFYICRDFFSSADTFLLPALQPQKSYEVFSGFDPHHDLEVYGPLETRL